MRSRLLVGFTAVLTAAGLFAAVADAAPAPQGAQAISEHAVCGPPSSGNARCFAHVVDHGRRPGTAATSSPKGLSPQDIKGAYGYTTSSTAGSGKTVAIVDAYDSPNVESDLNTFSSQFGLPLCTTGNGCFEKVDQRGGTNYPRSDAGWALEINLDVEWAHAIAPGATILLVEADSNSFTNLLTAVDYAAANADYVSMSWGAGEFSSEGGYDGHFSHAGTSFFASSGDSGLPAGYPSASPNVISVGGTTLNYSGGVLVSETGWSGSGGGCSKYETAPVAQSSFTEYGQSGCTGKVRGNTVDFRATPDVALDADPASGVSVFDSTKYYGQSGWFTVGGTSASSPMWAARSAVLGGTVDSSTVYGNTIPFRDIVSGNNGASAQVGYDLVTGRGSWADNGDLGTTTTTSPSSSTSSTSTSSTTSSTIPSTLDMSVARITWSTAAHGKHLLFTVAVQDSNGSPVGGATVSVDVDFNGSPYASGSGTTGSDGTVTFRLNNAAPGQYTATVTDVTASGYTWVPGSNDTSSTSFPLP